MYKITNRTKEPRLFRASGKDIIVPPKKSVHSSVAPNDPIVFKVEEYDEKKLYVEPDRDKLIALKGIEDELADALLRVYGDIESIKAKSPEEIADSISGIGLKRARIVLEQLN